MEKHKIDIGDFIEQHMDEIIELAGEFYDGDEIPRRWASKFNKLSAAERSKIIEKILNKYRSEKYISRWWDRGIEPPEDLYWCLLVYAQQYGIESPHVRELWTAFSSESYIIDDWLIQRLDGQGSKVLIEKIEFNFKVSKEAREVEDKAMESRVAYDNIFYCWLRRCNNFVEALAKLCKSPEDVAIIRGMASRLRDGSAMVNLVNSNIVELSGGVINIKLPDSPSKELIEKLGEEWVKGNGVIL